MSRKLLGLGLAAVIVPTREGTGWLEREDAHLNLQRLIHGRAIDCCGAATLCAAGHTLGRMHTALADCRETGVPDRFPLAPLLERAGARHAFLRTETAEAEALHLLADIRRMASLLA